MITEAKRIANHDRVVELLNSVSRDGIDELLKWLEESDFSMLQHHMRTTAHTSEVYVSIR